VTFKKKIQYKANNPNLKWTLLHYKKKGKRRFFFKKKKTFHAKRRFNLLAHITMLENI